MMEIFLTFNPPIFAEELSTVWCIYGAAGTSGRRLIFISLRKRIKNHQRIE
jgi:hypothetical protein